MRYGLITIDTPHSNRGNRLIEWALKKVLDLPEPAETASMFAPLSDDAAHRLNGCDFVLLAGSTIFADAPGNSEAMKTLDKLCVPIFCASASGWWPYAPYLGKEILKRITGPIGARDPHTHDYCERLGLESMFVGCPTAYVDPYPIKHKYSIVGFSRTEIEWQLEHIERRKPLTTVEILAAVQEASVEVPIAQRAGLPHFTYDDPEQVYATYASAIDCATGRLHGALPAMSQKIPVVFWGDKKDSRFSLLDFLNVPINPFGSQATKPAFVKDYCYHLQNLKEHFLKWGELTVGRCR